MHSLPILIDEVQYAPELFSYIERDVKEIADIDDTMLFSDLIRSADFGK